MVRASASRITGASSACSSAARSPRAIIVVTLTLLLIGAAGRAAGDALRLLRGAVAGQSRAPRAAARRRAASSSIATARCSRSNRPAFQLELVRERVPDVDATLQGLIKIGVLQRRRSRRDAQAGALAPQLRQRADPPAPDRRGNRALRRAPLRVPGRRHRDAPDALVSEWRARGARARLRGGDQRSGRQAAREGRPAREIRRHLADRQARHRGRV